jgi:ketosteroid isomerase-like protein
MSDDDFAAVHDELQIRNIIRAYNRALDDRRADDLAEVFAPDGVLHAMGASTRGREAIRALFAGAGPPQDRPLTAHHTSNTLITVGSDSATSESDFLVVRRGSVGVEVILAGRYRDRFVRLPEGWRIADRRAVALARPQA